MFVGVATSVTECLGKTRHRAVNSAGPSRCFFVFLDFRAAYAGRVLNKTLELGRRRFGLGAFALDFALRGTDRKSVV